MSDLKKHILFLPEWYPNPEDPQLGIFVQKHARAAALNYNVSLVYCGPFAKGNEIELYHKSNLGFDEYFCYYPKQFSKIRAYNYFLKAHKMCFQKICADKGSPDLAHLHMLYRNYIAWQKVYRKTIPDFLLTEQWSGYVSGAYSELKFWKKYYYKKAVSRAKKITAVSQRLADTMTKIFHPVKPIAVLPNIAEAVNSGVVKSKNHLYLLTVADLVDEIKNISDIIKAYLLAELNKPSVLTIVGDGPDREQLEKLAKENTDVNKQILFTGRLRNEQVLEIMTKNHFAITNSRHETFSMVTAEALLAGLPVICTRCGGPEEFVNDKNGILIPVDSRQGLVRAMENMSEKYSSFEHEKLSEEVLKRFGIEAVGKELKNIYQTILPA